MKKIITIILIGALFLCFEKCVPGIAQETQSVKDSYQITVLKDSIVKLNKRPIMTAEQFVQVYKYKEIEHYYKIATTLNKKGQRIPNKNMVFFKGWVIMTINQ